jgi:hypothetical protein
VAVLIHQVVKVLQVVLGFLILTAVAVVVVQDKLVQTHQM